MKYIFTKPKLHGKDILNLLIEINYLAVIFLVPLFFSYFFTTQNIFELNKLVLFKTLLWSLFLFSGFKFIFYCSPIYLFKNNKAHIFFIFKKYFIIPLIFIAGLGISLLFSTNLTQSFFGSYERQQGFLSYLFYVIWFLLLVINISSKNRELNKKKILRIIVTATASGFLVAFYGVLQILNIDFLTWSESIALSHRVTSSLGQPNFLASFLLLVIPLSLYLFLKSQKFLVKFFYSLIFITQVLCLFFTASRGGLLALILVIFGLIIFLLFKLKLSKLKRSLIVAGFLLTIIFAAWGLEHFLPGRVSSAVNLKYGSSAVRVIFYKVAVSAIAQKPFFGYGLENSSEIFIKYYEPDWGVYGDVGATSDRAHNLILDILLNGGIFLLIIFSVLYGQIIILIKKNIKLAGFNSLSLFLGLGLAAYLISLLFSFTIISAEVYFWLFFAILCATSLSEYLSEEAGAGNIDKRPVAIQVINQRWHFVYYIFASLLLSIIFIWGVNIEKRTLMADFYFSKLYYILAEKKFFDTFVLSEYILKERPNRVNQDFYDQFLAEKLSDFYPDIKELASKYIVQQEMERINSDTRDKDYKNILARARISGALGDLESSQKYFNSIKELTPFWPFLYLAQGQVLFSNAKYQAALDIYKEGILTLPYDNDPRLKNNNELHDQNVSLYYYYFNREIANSYFALNNYEQAEIYYQRAYRYNIQDYTLLKNIANTYYLRGNINEAIKYNERGYMRAPKDYNWLMGLAILYNEKKDNKKAVEYLDKALLLSPDNNELKKLKLEYGLFNLR